MQNTFKTLPPLHAKSQCPHQFPCLITLTSASNSALPRFRSLLSQGALRGGGDEQRKGEKRRMEGSGRGTREEKGKGGVERESDSRTSKQENFAD